MEDDGGLVIPPPVERSPSPPLPEYFAQLGPALSPRGGVERRGGGDDEERRRGDGERRREVEESSLGFEASVRTNALVVEVLGEREVVLEEEVFGDREELHEDEEEEVEGQEHRQLLRTRSGKGTSIPLSSSTSSPYLPHSPTCFPFLPSSSLSPLPLSLLSPLLPPLLFPLHPSSSPFLTFPLLLLSSTPKPPPQCGCQKQRLLLGV